MPLPADVGEAIVNYIRNGRAGHSRALFVSARTPHHAPFKNAQIINTVLEDAVASAAPQSRYRHAPERSVAGQVGDVLRHRSRMTTTIYAKYDIDALRLIARRWPVGGDAR